ncbi:NifB/NifX family molybdenum-iron cluster-binding protein [candidate division WOR-3 bacterium]|nr:NifB/NifX family molybdenum-iron cluster-binding protein [candidate division WOR-3 bacterium]
MVIAFATDDRNGLDGVLAYHFGRCPFFTFVKVEDGKVLNVRVEENPFAENHQVGVVPQWIKENGAEMIVAGGMGPRAQQMFASFGIRPVVGAYGKIGDILNQLLGGKVRIAEVEHEYASNHTYNNERSGSEEIRRLKLEVEQLRKIVADLGSRISELEEKF